MKEYVTLIVALTSIILSVIATFNKEQEKGEKLQDEYFKKILLTYFEIRKMNPKVNAIEYIQKYKFKEICIPSYIFYLADKGENEELEKLLLVDYWDNYPSVINNTNRVIDKFSKIMYFIGIIFFILTIMFLIYSLVVIIGLILSNIMNIFNFEFLKQITAAVILLIIFIPFTYWVKKSINNFGEDIDEYSMNIKKIKQIIKRKQKRYEKKKDKYYLYKD